MQMTFYGININTLYVQKKNVQHQDDDDDDDDRTDKEEKKCRMCISSSFHIVFMSNEYKRFMGCQIFF